MSSPDHRDFVDALRGMLGLAPLYGRDPKRSPNDLAPELGYHTPRACHRGARANTGFGNWRIAEGGNAARPRVKRLFNRAR